MNTVRKLHQWLSVALGIPVALICLSGAILVFEPEISSLVPYEGRLPFFKFMSRMHGSFFLPRPYGGIVVGGVTMAFAVILLTGVAMWWRQARHGLMRSLTIRRGRLWHGLHVAGGMYCLLMVLAMALTGMYWSFDWYASAFDALFGHPDWLWAVHSGRFGGIATRTLWCAAALLGATLPISGYWLWIKRLCRK